MMVVDRKELSQGKNHLKTQIAMAQKTFRIKGVNTLTINNAK